MSAVRALAQPRQNLPPLNCLNSFAHIIPPLPSAPPKRRLLNLTTPHPPHTHHSVTGESRWPQNQDDSGFNASFEVDDLPAGWELRTDPNTQAEYYFNLTSGESSWEKPTTPGTPVAANVENPWDERVDESSGRVYYYNKTTGQAVWEKPEEVRSQIRFYSLLSHRIPPRPPTLPSRRLLKNTKHKTPPQLNSTMPWWLPRPLP